ncbi:MAG TPA: methionine--tRNA ligase, partial [Phycisphaerae bacterium]|nr:methionine--tRNA ligase [Phycisphaerae bacterium]
AKARQILVTSALPYANGSIHIGHLVEYIQTDIWVRFQRVRGNTVTYVCGDDAHGTPIMLKARQENVSPEDYIARFHKEHREDFAKFGIEFDNFGSTHSELNKELSYRIYDRVKASGIIEFREIEQLFDPQANIFLPDRFVKGTCPNCKSPEQFGDSCEVCGKTFDPSDLINPVSVVSGATPVLKKSKHLFLKLEPARDFLLKLYESGFVDESVKNKLLDWFKEPLRSWDISRDAPFFGFPIPGEDGKFFYNWFDAPIGYLASLGQKLGENAAGTEEFWNIPQQEIFHFIGKDIQYFHALFWPVMLHAAGLKAPNKLAIHGHLTVNGKKMSKRDGTFIKASTFAKHLDSQYLRYYYATKLGPAPEDLDLSFEDFKARVDGELVNKLANLLSRCAPILTKLLEGKLGVSAMDALPLLREVRGAADAIAEAYESRNFAAATRAICALADQANKYVEDQAPWKLVKTDAEGARGVLTAGLEAGRILTIYLKPILPAFAEKVEKCLGLPPQDWNNVQDAMEPRKINTFEHLVQRLDMKAVEAMIEESKEAQKPAVSGQTEAVAAPAGQAVQNPGAASAAPAEAGEPLAATINIDQFAAVDLRVARVLAAEPLEKSDKLVKLTLDAGPIGKRTILAGIKKAYTPERLVGRLVIFCANLAPRAMGKGGSLGTSEGMICAASPFNGPAHEIFVLSPDEGAKPGQRVH